MTEQTRRQAVVAEALTWVGTPFHHEARLKGKGVDCAQLLIGVYSAPGVDAIEAFEPKHYSYQWHLHRSEEIYLVILRQLGHEIPGPPLPGDVAVWKVGRAYSHAAIVIDWPLVVHACAPPLGRCLRENALESALKLAKLPVRFFSAWESA